MDGLEIRRRFLRYFEDRGHHVVPSASLIPNDPTLLITNAGMVPFKPFFLGLQTPPFARMASVQKSFRTGDIDLVGHTARHLTFFEMLGNFSFGDYFKREAVAYAWELVTSPEGFALEPDRLWVTVFESDDEAMATWRDDIGIPPERIVRRGMADNFWSMGVAGPCGPCSEIYYDRGAAYGPEGGPAADEERFLEIWNLVFMQNERDDAYRIVGELSRKGIDTGLGLERMAVVQQKADTLFDTDLLRPLVSVAEELTGRRYGEDPGTDVSLRVMAEHGRATTMLMADGVLPSNEGRGYVLRRMLRRMITHARKLGVDRAVAGELVQATVKLLGPAYPELGSNEPFVLQVAASEEERFTATYRQGMTLFETEVARVKAAGSTTISGEAAFRLHDTFGFQQQLTLELAAEEGLAVDVEAFDRLMDEQRERARGAHRKGDVSEGPLGEIAQASGPTDFLGYERLASDARVVGLVDGGGRVGVAGEGSPVRLVLNRTPFYAEGGGQVGDAGSIRTAGGQVRVTDTRPGPGGTIVHEGVVVAGEVRQGEEAEATVDADRRAATARSHTATHVLHHTIRQMLGEHARQAGSLVAPGRLRFDFTHFEAVPTHQLEEIEYLANRRLADDQPVRAYETTFEFARSAGAIALFGEKYGDLVRVVEVGDYSVELCGGTHVRHTGQVGLIRLTSEGSIGSGFRRVDALTGPDALKQVNVERRLLEEVVEALGAGDPDRAPERARHAVARIKKLESELGKIHKAEREREVEIWASRAQDVGGVSLVTGVLEGRDADALREIALGLRNRLAGAGLGAAVVGSAADGRALLVAAVTEGLIERGVTAPALVQRAAGLIGGGAGGKDGLAFAGGRNAAALGPAVEGIAGDLADLLGARASGTSGG